MSQPCATCGNVYERSLEVTLDDKTYTFDSFQCAIHHLAPLCGRCGCRVIGAGVQAKNAIFCSAHCAREEGVEGLQTHV